MGRDDVHVFLPTTCTPMVLLTGQASFVTGPSQLQYLADDCQKLQ